MWQTTEHAEQRELKGTITVITLQSAIIEGCGYTMFDNTPSTEKFFNLYPHGALNQANTVLI